MQNDTHWKYMRWDEIKRKLNNYKLDDEWILTYAKCLLVRISWKASNIYKEKAAQ